MAKVSELPEVSPATVAALRQVTGVDVLEAGQVAGMLGFATKADMDADLAHDAGTLALVTNDPTPANNGTYRKTGASGAGSWVKSADRVQELRDDLAGPTGATLVTLPGGRTLAQTVSAALSSGSEIGVVIGDQTHDAKDIGNGSVLIGGTRTAMKNRMPGTNGHLRTIVGGYDCEIGNNTVACAIFGSHHSIISPGVTHGSVFGGSYNDIEAGDYGTIGGGSGNTVAASNATVSGGANNTARGADAAIGGGSTNTIPAGASQNTIAGGINNQVTAGNGSAIPGGVGNKVGANWALASGYQSEANAAAAFAFGYQSKANGQYSAAIGRENLAASDYGFATGRNSTTRTPGGFYNGAGMIDAQGDAQSFFVTLKGKTTDASTFVLTTASNANVITGPTAGVMAFRALVSAYEPATGDAKTWEIKGGWRRHGGTAAMIGAPTVTVLAESAGAAAWTAGIASSGAGGIRIDVKGEAAKTIKWSARVEATEVSG